MNVLGISGSERDAAAAIVRDGRIVSAASEDMFARIPGIGYSATGGYPLRAIQACLDRAGISLDAIDRIVVVDDASAPVETASKSLAEIEELARGLRGRQFSRIDPLHADAHQVRVAADGDLAIFVADDEAISLVEGRGGRLSTARRIPGTVELMCAVKRIAGALHGRPVVSPLAAIERVAACGSGDADAGIARAIQLGPGGCIQLDESCLVEVIASLQPAQGLENSPYRLERLRQAVAVGFCDRLDVVLGELVGEGMARAGATTAGLAGALFRSSRLTGALARSLGDRVAVAPVPEASGRAIGAAVSGNGAKVDRLGTLALGPEFDEQQIKNVLDNCRLEYLYEPDWPALLARVSRTLARGLIVAWFQGPAPFGARSIGTRSILCDPSNRYTRDNVNRFLRHGASEEPLDVSMSRDAATDCLEAPPSGFAAIDSLVRSEWRDRLKASVDRRGYAPIQTVTSEQAPQFVELLEAHRRLTGVPGLIDLPLNGHGEPIACAPREAVRSFFSSAVDALIIGRFLLMKDYWLLRSGAEA